MPYVRKPGTWILFCLLGVASGCRTRLWELPPPIAKSECPGAEPGAPWPMMGRCGSHDGRSQFITPLHPRVLWSVNAHAAFDTTQPAIAASGTIFVPTVEDDSRGSLSAFDGATGKKRWTHVGTKGWFSGTPALAADGSVLIGDVDGVFHSLDPARGLERWRFQAGGAIFKSSVIGPDGTVYFCSVDERTYALEATTGRLKWTFTADFPILGSPTVGDGGLVVVKASEGVDADQAGYVYGIEAATGLQRWKVSVGAYASDAVIDSEGRVYIGAGANFRVIDGTTGEVKWNLPINKSVAGLGWTGLGGISADGRVLVNTALNGIYAVDGDTGAATVFVPMRWAWVWESITVDGAGTVIYTDQERNGSPGTAYGADGQTGATLWSFALEQKLYPQTSTASIGKGGVIYLLNEDGWLTALGE